MRPAATFRAPGAKTADKAAVCLLLAALATLWLFERDYSLEKVGYRTTLTLQSLTLAANLAPEHRFLMFLRQTGATIEDRAYVPYNRFPIGTYLVLKAVLLPFGHNLAAQIRAAQSVTLLFFAGAALLAYLALRRLRHGPWVALTATLLAFSSFYSLHYADTVSTEIASLFGLWLTAYGLVRFAHDERLRPLLAKAGIALLLGWHVMGLLLPFVVIGLTQVVRRARPIRSRGGAGARLRLLLGSPYLRLGLAATLFCAALLAFNVANEYVALQGETPWTRLPTVQSFLRRSVLRGERALERDHIYEFASEQWRRIGTLTAPYALVRGLDKRDAAPPFFMAVGLAVFSLCLLGLRDARPRRVPAAWLLSGWSWALAVPGSAYIHEFEALFHLGIPLLFFAQSLQGLRRRGLPEACLPGAALALFSLSALQVSRRLPPLEEFPGYRETLADFTAMRPLVAGRSVCVPAHLEFWVGTGFQVGTDPTKSTITPLSYYLAGSQVDYSPDYCASSPSDFTLAPVRVEGAALLTPANRILFLYAVPALEETPYRAALRGLLSAAPLARAEFDLYALRRALVYYRPTACPADRQRFVLHVEPVRVPDLPAHRRPHGFDNLNFNWGRRGLQLNGQCLAIVPLPAYSIARIRAGQYATRGGEGAWETEFPFRPTYEAALRAVQTAVPLARAEFDVHAREGRLIYYKAACDPADAQARFFLHVEPVNVDDLPAPRRAHGFDNRDFDFARRGARLDHRCLALAPLPRYPIARIRTGQGARADGANWEVEVRLPVRS